MIAQTWRNGLLQRRWLALAAVATITLCAALAMRSALAEGRLLRADPDSVPLDRAMLRRASNEGRAVFARHCATCHGPLGRGDHRTGVPDLADANWLYGEGRVSEIERIVQYGIRSHHPMGWNLADMPAYAQPVPYPREPAIQPLGPGDVRDMVEFLTRLEGRPADARAAARGAQVFGGRGACWDCHGHDARGDPAIGAPDLRGANRLYGDGRRSAILQTLERGRHGVCPSWTGRIPPAGIRSVAVFVHALSHPEKPGGVG